MRGVCQILRGSGNAHSGLRRTRARLPGAATRRWVPHASRSPPSRARRSCAYRVQVAARAAPAQSRGARTVTLVSPRAHVTCPARHPGDRRRHGVLRWGQLRVRRGHRPAGACRRAARRCTFIARCDRWPHEPAGAPWRRAPRAPRLTAAKSGRAGPSRRLAGARRAPAGAPSAAAGVPLARAGVPSAPAGVPPATASVSSGSTNVPPGPAGVPPGAAGVPSAPAGAPSGAAGVPSAPAGAPSATTGSELRRRGGRRPARKRRRLAQGGRRGLQTLLLPRRGRRAAAQSGPRALQL